MGILYFIGFFVALGWFIKKTFKFLMPFYFTGALIILVAILERV